MISNCSNTRVKKKCPVIKKKKSPSIISCFILFISFLISWSSSCFSKSKSAELSALPLVLTPRNVDSSPDEPLRLRVPSGESPLFGTSNPLLVDPFNLPLPLFLRSESEPARSSYHFQKHVYKLIDYSLLSLDILNLKIVNTNF